MIRYLILKHKKKKEVRLYMLVFAKKEIFVLKKFYHSI